MGVTNLLKSLQIFVMYISLYLYLNTFIHGHLVLWKMRKVRGEGKREEFGTSWEFPRSIYLSSHHEDPIITFLSILYWINVFYSTLVLGIRWCAVSDLELALLKFLPYKMYYDRTLILHRFRCSITSFVR